MANTPSVTGNRTPLNWVNNLRFFALLAVITLHAGSPLLGDYKAVPRGQWLAADFYNALTRFAVPVFVMITGALLLGKDDDVVSFLKKRLGRVVWPFLFWSLVYIAYAFYNEDIPYTADVWANIKQALHQFKYGASYHLWYVYMLIGLYLIIPVLGKFIRNASQKEILYFIVVWLMVMMIGQPYLKRYDPQIDTRYFAGYTGYLVLGYYLANKNFESKYLPVFMAALFLLTVSIIAVGTSLLYDHYSGISTLMYEPLSWPVVILSSGAFLFFKSYQPRAPVFFTAVRDFTGRFNYGIYLGHALILTLLDYPDLTGFSLTYKSFNPMLSIPATALVCFAITLLMVYLVHKIPFVGKYISG